MRRSSVAVAVIAALFILLPSSPASAHATFVGAPNGYPANSEQTLTMNVPHERENTTYNVAVSVRIPASWGASSCQSKPTWTCSIDVVEGRQIFRFAKNPGSEVAEDETFQFAVRTAPAAGTFPFETVQTYKTGEVVSWIGAAGTANPAPMLSTLPGGTAPQSTPPTTNPDARPTTTTGAPATSVATTTSTLTTNTTIANAITTATSSATTTIATTDSDDDDEDGGGTTTVGLVALIAIGAAGGLLVSRRYSHSRRRNTA
ncbi:MAG TPA: DUF1775 domain-containing protein [Acidimicrobiales bacterium]|nr:DUF1775 domain-containing protein [Acidimicrobiales bacterium]